MIPDLTYIVEQARISYPQAWKDAHTGNERTEDFIRIVAKLMHAVNPGFGLNGKRGNPQDISDDAVNFIGEGPGTTPGGRPCTVIDIIGAAGSPQARPQWGVQTDPIASSGAWVNPNSAPGLPPAPSPVKPPLSKSEAFAALQALNAFYAAPEGLQRPGGLVLVDRDGRSVADMEAIAQWFHQLVIDRVSLEDVFTQIRASHEWRSKHP